MEPLTRKVYGREARLEQLMLMLQHPEMLTDCGIDMAYVILLDDVLRFHAS